MKNVRTSVLAVVAPVLALTMWVVNHEVHPTKIAAQKVSAPPYHRCLRQDTDTFDPGDPADVLRWITHVDKNDPAGKPRWVHWCTKEDVGLEPAPQPPSPVDNADSADERALPPLPLVQRSGTKVVLTAPVLFNAPAATAILSAQKGGKLEGVPVFPAGSIIVKTIWEVQTSTKHSNDFGPVGITTETMATEASYDGTTAAEYANLQQRAAVGPREDTGCTVTELSSIRVNPYACFYIISLDKRDVEARIQMLRGNTPGQTSCSTLPCRVVLVGFHVMLKTQNGAPDWKFMTFWLTPNKQPYGLGPGPWQFFTYNTPEQSSATARSVLKNAASMGPAPAFSPYLEGQELYGVASNCVTCHTLARYNPGASQASNRSNLEQQAQTPGFGIPAGGKIALASIQEHVQQQNNYRQQTPVSTDFVWSIVTYYSKAGQANTAGN